MCYEEEFAESRKPENQLVTDCFEHYSVKAAGQVDGELREGVYVDVLTNTSHVPVSLMVQHKPWHNMCLLPPYEACREGQVLLNLLPGEKKVVVKKQRDLLAPHEFSMLVKPCVNRTIAVTLRS